MMLHSTRGGLHVPIWRRVPKRWAALTNWTPRLPDDALVIRGGTLLPSDLQRSVLKAIKELRRPALSIFSADVLIPADLVESAGSRLIHTSVCLSTAGRLRKAGFVLEQTFEPPHYSVWLSETNWHDQLSTFRSAFDVPVPVRTLGRVQADPGRPSK